MYLTGTPVALVRSCSQLSPRGKIWGIGDQCCVPPPLELRKSASNQQQQQHQHPTPTPHQIGTRSAQDCRGTDTNRSRAACT